MIRLSLISVFRVEDPILPDPRNRIVINEVRPLVWDNTTTQSEVCVLELK